MELLKKLFKDDEKVIGLCAFKKQEEKNYSFVSRFSADKMIYKTNYEKNFFLL